MQFYKEIIARRKSNNALIRGPLIQVELGLPFWSKKFKIKLDDIPDFEVFYLLTKPESVEAHKKIILREKPDGALVAGQKLREKYLGKKLQIKPDDVADYDIFVQSTSDFFYDVTSEAVIKVRIITIYFY